MATGSRARLIADADSTPSQPSSIARAASEAVPTPASSRTGASRRSAISAMRVGVADAEARPDRRAERHDRDAADLLEALGRDQVVRGVGPDLEALVDERVGGAQRLGRVGQQRLVVADDLELDRGRVEGLARQVGGLDRLGRAVAARGVGQQREAEPLEQVVDRALDARVDAAQRDGRDRRRPTRRALSSSTSIERNPPVPITRRDVERVEPTSKRSSTRASVLTAAARLSRVGAVQPARRPHHRRLGLRRRRRRPGRPAHVRRLRGPRHHRAHRADRPEHPRGPGRPPRRPRRSSSPRSRRSLDDLDVAAVKTGMLAPAGDGRGRGRARRATAGSPTSWSTRCWSRRPATP